jgi:hypothetical protein
VVRLQTLLDCDSHVAFLPLVVSSVPQCSDPEIDVRP